MNFEIEMMGEVEIEDISCSQYIRGALMAIQASLHIRVLGAEIASITPANKI